MNTHMHRWLLTFLFVIGCERMHPVQKRALLPQPTQSNGSEVEQARWRAWEEILKIEWLSNTNGHRSFDASFHGRDQNGDYLFVFKPTDFPDVHIIARVSSNAVVLSGSWFPPR